MLFLSVLELDLGDTGLRGGMLYLQRLCRASPAELVARLL